MARVTEGGVWELELPSTRVSEGQTYKYRIYGCGKVTDKADPYAFRSELPPKTASVVATLEGYTWRDSGWLAHRKRKTGKMYS